MKREYRVYWKREGRAPKQRIYQTLAGAQRLIDAVVALDELKGDSVRYSDMPDLAEPPRLEVRDCSPWRDTGAQGSIKSRAGDEIVAKVRGHDHMVTRHPELDPDDLPF